MVFDLYVWNKTRVTLAILYNELDNVGIESINAFQYDTGIDPTNTIRHNATLVLYQDAETSHMVFRCNSISRFGVWESVSK